jgi:LuxR family transcriptional regulator, maltose regulon positive regulatory protein
MNDLQSVSSNISSDLLSTKLSLPRLRHSLVSREPLFAQLDHSLDHTLTLLSAPAGFGKTTVIRAWIASRTTKQKPFRVAWLSLDTGDNGPVRFWRYMIAACQRLEAAIGQTALARLRSLQPLSLEIPMQFPFEELLTTLINDLSKLPDPCILVLEDYHAITLPQIHRMLSFFLDHLPATLHMLLLSRSDPPLPLASLRAHGDILEIRASDLRFSLAETRMFLQQTLPFPLSEETMMYLHERTEGWGAGLNLLVCALRRYTNPSEQAHFLSTLTGKYRPLLEYLVSDVLDAQSETLQTFLLQTGGLGHVTGSLCDTVTGRNDSELLLEQVERANLFLEPLDGAGQWYRYHVLFAEAMLHEARRRLGKDALHACFGRASIWYEQHHQIANAIEAALLAEDFTRTAALVERLSGSLYALETNEHYTLRRWLGQVPQEILHSHPALCLVYVVALLFDPDGRVVTDTARREQIETLLNLEEQHCLAEHDTARLGEAYALRALLITWQGNLQQAGRLARQALACLKDVEIAWRSMCLSIIGAEERFSGSLAIALQMAQESLALVQRAENPYGSRALLLELGETCIARGELHQADASYRQVLSNAGEDLFDRSKALLGLAQISYEWNQLDIASQEAQEAHDLATRIADVGLQVQSSLILARILYASGNTIEAQQQLTKLVAYARVHHAPLLYRESLFWQARFQLASGDLASVQHWMKHRSEDDEPLSFSLQAREDLLIARLLLARGELQEAQRLLEQCLNKAHNHAYTSSVIETQILTALAYFHQNNRELAWQALQTVLTQLRTESYRRLFLDEGQTMAACLRASIPGNTLGENEIYLHALLPLFESDQSEQPSGAFPAPSLIEPLSSQEQRVLRLFVAGLSKPEIAQELVISTNTVKTHLQHIYRKLHISSRVEAREAARRFHLR